MCNLSLAPPPPTTYPLQIPPPPNHTPPHQSNPKSNQSTTDKVTYMYVRNKPANLTKQD